MKRLFDSRKTVFKSWKNCKQKKYKIKYLTNPFKLNEVHIIKETLGEHIYLSEPTVQLITHDNILYVFLTSGTTNQ